MLVERVQVADQLERHEPVHPRPQLDELLAAVQAPLAWAPEAANGRGAYRRPAEFGGISSGMPIVLRCAIARTSERGEKEISFSHAHNLALNALTRIVERMLSDPPGTEAVAGSVLVRNSRRNVLTKAQEWDYFHGIAAVKRMQSMYHGTLVAQGAFSLYEREALREVGGWPDCVGEDMAESAKAAPHLELVTYNFVVPLEEHGNGVCIGYEYDGPGRDAQIIEVKLLVSASLAAAWINRALRVHGHNRGDGCTSRDRSRRH